MKLPHSFIDDLLSKVDIVEIIGSKVNLRKAGSNFNALCPFHNEKTPSFTVSPSKQFYHCFGCGAHGSAIGFLMQFENLSFIDAVENLASHAGMTLPKDSYAKNEPKFTELYKLMEKVANHYVQTLRKSEVAVDYLKSRGLNGIICQQFGIGFANSEWDNLISIHRNQIAIKKQLITAGLLIQKNNFTYSRFRNRIMFPIRDVRGHIIAFGGRTIVKDPAKYINSPETPIYHKGNELYGLFEAKSKKKKLEQIIVVEGYMDVVTLSQYDITNVVATSGTAITLKQIQQLLRQTKEIIFCFDGDSAGKAAAVRALENSLPHLSDGVQIKFLFLPETDDPDSMIRREGREAFLKRFDQAIPLSDFFFNSLTSKININTMDGKSLLAKEAKIYLEKMPNGIFKKLMLTKLSETIKISIEEFDTLSERQDPLYIKQQNQDKTCSHFHNVILLLSHYPQLIELIENIDNISCIKHQDAGLLIRLYDFLKNQPNSTIGAILEYWRANFNDADYLGTIIAKEPIIGYEGLKNEFIGSIHRIHQYQKEQKIEQLLKKAALGLLSQEEKQLLQQLITDNKKNLNYEC